MRKLPTKSEKRLFRCVDQKASILKQNKCSKVFLLRVVIKEKTYKQPLTFDPCFQKLFTATFVKFQQPCKKKLRLIVQS